METVGSGRATDPMELIIGKESMDSIEQKLFGLLTSLEREVLQSYVEGRSYEEIATNLNRRVKSIDNALQRVKRKIERYLIIGE
jgi:RNA polymerase sporulation-specific sigma factor